MCNNAQAGTATLGINTLVSRHLQFASCVQEGKSIAPIIDETASTVISRLPGIALIIGSDPAYWHAPFTQLLENIHPSLSHARLTSVAPISAVDAALRTRSDAISDLALDYGSDIGARLRAWKEKRIELDPALKSGTSTKSDGDSLSKSFAAAARDYKNEGKCSYMSIKRDLMKQRSDPSIAAAESVKLVLNGKTPSSLDRRSNAIMLTMASDTANIYLSVDSDLSWLAASVTRELPILLGDSTNCALGYPSQAVVPPHILEMCSIVNSL